MLRPFKAYPPLRLSSTADLVCVLPPWTPWDVRPQNQVEMSSHLYPDGSPAWRPSLRSDLTAAAWYKDVWTTMTVLRVAINSDTDDGVERVSAPRIWKACFNIYYFKRRLWRFSQILYVGNLMRKLLITLFNEVEESVYNITSFYGRIIEHWKLMALKDTINITFHRVKYIDVSLRPITISVIVLKCINCLIKI